MLRSAKISSTSRRLEAEHVIQPDSMADDLGGKPMAVMRVGAAKLHAVSLGLLSGIRPVPVKVTMPASVIVNDPGFGRGGEVTEEKPADAVVEEITGFQGRASANYSSVADYASAGRMVAQCVDTYGKIDFLVNVAGMLRERMIWNMTEDDFDQVISVHLKGHWNMCHHATKVMRGARYGRIVNFSSDAFKGSVGQCNYAAAKAGIIGLTRTIANEAGRYGITANAMCPMAATRMTVNDARDCWLEAAS